MNRNKKTLWKRILVSGFLSLSAMLPMTSVAEQSELETAKAMYAAFSSGDMVRVLSLFAPDVELIFHAPENGIPYAGTWKGKAGVEAFFTGIAKHINILEIGQRQFTTNNNVVSVLGWEKGVSHATNGEYLANWVHVMTIKDGQIVHFEEVTDSAAIESALQPADSERGRAFYTTCLGCHGLQAQGMRSMHAPRLTLLDGPYLLRQLRNFRSHTRGGIQDFYGWQMNGRAAALPGDRAIRDVIAYINTLPDTLADDKLDGDLEQGQRLYKSTCAVCHGGEGEGDVALSAPRLTGMESWYQLAQLQKFKQGIRGSKDGDTIGLTMAASMSAVPDEQAMRDIVAYVRSLSKQ